MKKIKILMLLAISISLFGCSRLDGVTPTNDPTSSTLNNYTGGTIVITEATKDDTVEFSWSESYFGYPAAITYNLMGTLESNYPVTDQTKVILLSSTQTTTTSMLHADLNNKVNEMDAVAASDNNIVLWIVSSITDDFVTNIVNHRKGSSPCLHFGSMGSGHHDEILIHKFQIRDIAHRQGERGRQRER